MELSGRCWMWGLELNEGLESYGMVISIVISLDRPTTCDEGSVPTADLEMGRLRLPEVGSLSASSLSLRGRAGGHRIIQPVSSFC